MFGNISKVFMAILTNDNLNLSRSPPVLTICIYLELSFKGSVYGVKHLLLLIKNLVLVSSFQIKHLSPSQTMYNTSIQDDISEGHPLYRNDRVDNNA